MLIRAGFLAGLAISGGVGCTKIATANAESDAQQQIAAMQEKLDDWAQLGHYREANKALAPAAAGEDRVVFFGASMTEFWGRDGSVFFPGKPYVNRGEIGRAHV